MSNKTQDMSAVTEVVIHNDPAGTDAARGLQDMLLVSSASQVARMHEDTDILRDAASTVYAYLFGAHDGRDAESYVIARSAFARVWQGLIDKGQQPGTLTALCARHIMLHETAQQGDLWGIEREIREMHAARAQREEVR